MAIPVNTSNNSTAEIIAREKGTVIASWVSLVVSFLVMASKFYAYYLTQSTAILSDAAESVVNVIAASAAVFVMKEVAAPADKEHPYGHGKLEYFSAAFEGGLIAFASVAIFQEALRALINGEGLNDLSVGTYIMGGAAVVNLMLSLYLGHIAKKFKSEALMASSKHVMSDVITTVGVLVGIGIIFFTNLTWLDPIIAMAVALQLAYSGYKIVRTSAGGLLDEFEPQSLAKLAEAFQSHRKDWVIDIHQLKVIRSGHFHHIDGHLVVPEFWNISTTHELSHQFELEVVGSYPFDGEIAFHLDPCERKYCDRCGIKECPVRISANKGVPKFSVETLIKGPQVD